MSYVSVLGETRVVCRLLAITLILGTVSVQTVYGQGCPATSPAVAVTAVITGPPTQIQITAQDTDDGLKSIVVTTSTNATTVVPAFTVGTTSPVVVTATAISQIAGSTVTLTVTDLCGNVTTRDFQFGGCTTTPPAVALTAVITGPPMQIQITAQDTDDGLKSIVVAASTNATTVVPPFTVGTTSPVVVPATTIDQNAVSFVTLTVTDLCGNVTTRDFQFGGPPVITKSFGSTSIQANGSTSLSFNITNPNATPLTGVGFTDTLPAGLIVSTPNGLTGSCDGGTNTASAGSNSISLSGATLAASSSCTFSVNVTGTTAGVKNNSVTVFSTNGGTGNTSSASLTVLPPLPPTIVKAFADSQVQLFGPNSSTALSFTLTNPNAATTLTSVGFTDTLPAGLIVSTPNGLTGSCGGGTITAIAGSNNISLSGATRAAGASCTFSVNVTGIAIGVQTNTTSTLTSNEAPPGAPATASIFVDASFFLWFFHEGGGGGRPPL